MRSELLETINPSKNIVSSTYSSGPNILQTALYEINEAVDVSENLDDLYKSVHDTISKIMKADNFYIAIYYREEQKISFPYFVDEEEIFEEHKQKFDLGRGLTAYVIRSGQSMLCDLDRYKELVQSGQLEVLGPPPRIWLGVPLKIGYEIIGVMAVQDYKDAATYGEQEKRMLEYVSSQVAKVIYRKRAEEKILNSEFKYRKLFESANDAIFLMTGDTFIDCNAKTEEMFGCTREQILLRKPYEFSPLVQPDGRNSKEKAIEKISNAFAGVPQFFEWKHVKLDGTPFFAEVSLNHIVIDGKDMLQAIVRDITERKNSEEELKLSEQKYRDLFTHAPVGIYQADRNGKIISANAMLANILGYGSVQELLTVNLKDIYLNEEERDALIKKFEPFGSAALLEVQWKKKSGEPIWIQMNAHAVKDANSQTLYFEGFVYDINDKKEFEKRIVCEKDKAEEANRLKSGFLSAMSHEIRTPLNAIIGYNDVLRYHFYDSVDEEVKLAFDSVEKGGLRLLDTIINILDISRLEANEFPINFQSLSFNELLISAYRLMKKTVESKGLKIITDIPTEQILVHADSYCLDSVVINVLNNAIKYSKEGEIKVSLCKFDTYAECIITDQGIGMSEDYQRHLFEPFSQEDVGINRSYEGSGLGLAITKRFIDLINGEIEINSKKGVGTTVTLKIPLSKVNE
ncbi:MAG: PAS domain S-box protein [Bacteroidetes bacterium]|nr:PAS domain S-box protein [Bacteroidota bacterium]MBU2585775.1 PAS domain S-box protein [Bacteroidota bacterium]